MGRRNKEKHGAKLARFDTEPTVMSFSINRLDRFKDKLMVVQTGRFNWTAHIYRGRFYEEDYAVFDLYCHCPVSNWSQSTEVDVLIAGGKTSTRIEHHYEHKRNCVSCPPLIKWSDLVNPENGYIQNGRIEFEVRIFDVPKKVCRNALIVSKVYPGITNLEIVVGKSSFRLNRELLAWTSAFFCDELRAGKLRDDEPYVVDGIAAKDFRLYLDLVYHPKQYFSSYHAKDMLETAKRFRNTEIVTTCQNVIMEDLKENNLSQKDRTKLAADYDVNTVKDLFTLDPTPKSYKPRFMVLENEDELRKKEEKHMQEFVDHMRSCHRELIGEGLSDEEDIDQSVPSTSGCSGY